MESAAEIAGGLGAGLPPWLEFLTLANINVRLVLAGCVLLGIGAGALGCFAFLRKRALLGDALAHAALPGVCAAFMLTGLKDTYVMLAGAVVSCWMGAISIDLITKHTRCKEESALGMVLSVYFGVGVLLLTHIQQSGAGNQAGLDKFLFGQAAVLVEKDVYTFALTNAIMLALVLLAYKEFKIVSFDAEFARSLGLPATFIEVSLATLIVLAVGIGLQAVGVVLMAAMLVTPAAAARYWTDRLGVMIVLAGVFGAVSGFLGPYISYLNPKMPTGPWMVVAVTALFVVSLGLAPRRGVVWRWMRYRRFRRKTAEENILRTLYVLGEEAGDYGARHAAGRLLQRRAMKGAELERTLARLRAQGLVEELGGGEFALTGAGRKRGERLTRLHRLWELYLTLKVAIAPDHVHDDAEEIEHIITPEIEARLEEVLNSPPVDPHFSRIPGSGAGLEGRP